MSKPGEPWTFYDLLWNIELTEAAHCRNAAKGEPKQQEGGDNGLWWRVQDGVLQFHPAAWKWPGVEVLEAICYSRFGSGLTGDNLRRIRASLITDGALSTDDIHAMTVQELVDRIQKRRGHASMSDVPLSNIRGRITAPAEMLETAIAELLRRIPDTWEAYRPDDLTETQAQALFLLTAAGMVERRERVRQRMFNHPVVAEATITFTGEYGGFEAVEQLAASLWTDWQDAFREWAKSDAANSPSGLCERLEPSEWRLTDQGVVELKNLSGTEQDRRAVLDFVLQRGLYDRKPHVSPFNGRVFQQKPVRGKGALVKMDKAKADAAPATVNVGNWKEGGDAFGPAIVKMFEAMRAKAEQATAKAAAPLPDGRTPDAADMKRDDAKIRENSATRRNRKGQVTPKRGSNRRKSLSPEQEAEVFEKSRRRCCVCFALKDDATEKSGQLAHLDHDRANNDPHNFVFLCLEHHDRYDGKTSQSKGMTPTELRRYREMLYAAVQEGRVPAAGHAVNQGSERVSVAGNHNMVAGRDLNVTVQLPSTPRRGKRTRTTPTPVIPGTVSEDARMIGYLDYLINRYNAFKKWECDTSGEKMNWPLIRVAYEREMHYKVRHTPRPLFNRAVRYLQNRIENTRLGRTRRGCKLYSTFEGFDGSNGKDEELPGQ